MKAPKFTALGDKSGWKIILRLSSTRREGPRLYMTTMGAGAYLVDPTTGICEGTEGTRGYTLQLVPSALRRLRKIERDSHQITSDGKTVWINGMGGLLGRFGLQGIDVHRPLTEQEERGECLHCTHGPTTRQDWDVFVQKMKEHFGVTVPERFLPDRFRV